MAVVENLLVRLTGEGSSFNKMITSAVNQTNKLASTVSKAGANISQIGSSTTKVGKNLTMGLTVPAAIAGGASVKQFADFDQAMTQSTSIMGVNQQQIDQLRKTALDLSASGQVLQTPKEMAESYFFLASAGLSAEESMAALPKVASFATAGAFDMALATDLLTDAQSALGLSTGTTAEKMENMQRVADVLVKANTLANATVEQFSEALTTEAGAAFKIYNKSVEEGVAVLAAYADQGIKGRLAGANAARMTRILAEQGIRSAKAHAKLGFAVFDANGKMNTYGNIIAQLETITAGMSDETRAATLAQLGFGAEVQNAILPLLGSSDAILRYEEKLNQAKGTTDEIANNQMASFSNQLKVVANRSAVLAIGIGQALAPAILRFNELLGQLTNWFMTLDPQYQQMIAMTAAAAIALGPLLVGLGLLISSIGKIVTLVSVVIGFFGSWIAIIFVAVGAVLALVIGARALLGSWEAVGEFFKNLGTLIADALVFAVRVGQRIFVTFLSWLVVKVQEVFTMDFVQSVIAGLRKAGEAIVQFGKFAIAKLRAIFTGSESGTFDDFMAQYIGYMNEGRNSQDIMGTLKNIVGEEYAAFQANRAGQSLVPLSAQSRVSDSVSAVQSAIGLGKDNATKVLDEISVNTSRMIDALNNNGETPIYLSPLALNQN